MCILGGQNRPTGDCYVQMSSVEAASKASDRLHKRNMGSRYIEVFQVQLPTAYDAFRLFSLITLWYVLLILLVFRYRGHICTYGLGWSSFRCFLFTLVTGGRETEKSQWCHG